MKKNKIIICLASILCLANFGYSKDSYYYYKGDRIPLKLSDDCMNVYTSQHEIALSNVEQMDINNLPSGVYVVLLKENEEVIAQTKVHIY